MEIKASVVIADASEEYRTILKKTMESTGEFQVVGSAGSGVEKRRADTFFRQSSTTCSPSASACSSSCKAWGTGHRRLSWCLRSVCSAP